jgi:hypothetical protein
MRIPLIGVNRKSLTINDGRVSQEGVVIPVARTAWTFADRGKMLFPGMPDANKTCLKGETMTIAEALQEIRQIQIRAGALEVFETAALPLPGQEGLEMAHYNAVEDALFRPAGALPGDPRA